MRPALIRLRLIFIYALMTIYFVGYFAFVIGAAITSWPHLTFFEWLNYMEWQLFYAMFWPGLLIGGLLGGWMASRPH